MTRKEKTPNQLDSIKISGNRIGVLLVHGFGGTPAELDYMAKAMSRAGYTVHCPMIPGMADNTDIFSLSAWEDWYGAVKKAHDALREKCDAVIVGGVSIGSLLALKLAAEFPDRVQGLMLFAPILWPNGSAIPWRLNIFRIVLQKRVARFFRFTLRSPYGIKNEVTRQGVIAKLTSDGRSVADVMTRNGGVVFELKRLAAAVWPLLPGIQQRTVIFHPRDDDQSDLSTVAKLQRKLGGLVETYILDNCYHRILMDRQGPFVVERSVDFAARLVRQTEMEAAKARMIKEAGRGAATIRAAE